jgi:hypothetical protein
LGLLKPFPPRKIRAVPEISSSTSFILLSAAVGLLVLLLGLVIGISRRLRRIEVHLIESENRQSPSGFAPSAAETSSGGAFEAFLAEDPARRKLPKGEQFAAYRRWRQENGMNWTNS